MSFVAIWAETKHLCISFVRRPFWYQFQTVGQERDCRHLPHQGTDLVPDRLPPYLDVNNP